MYLRLFKASVFKQQVGGELLISSSDQEKLIDNIIQTPFGKKIAWNFIQSTNATQWSVHVGHCIVITILVVTLILTYILVKCILKLATNNRQ